MPRGGLPSAYDEDVQAFSPPSGANENLACQLLIAGGGLSGLSAAEAAMRQGLDVIVIEKGVFGKEAASGLNAGQFLTGWANQAMIAELTRQEQERGLTGERALARAQRRVRAFLRRTVEGCQRLEQLNHEYNLRASVQHGATIAAVSEAALADVKAGYEFMQRSNLSAMMPAARRRRRSFYQALSARELHKRCGTAEDFYSGGSIFLAAAFGRASCCTDWHARLLCPEARITALHRAALKSARENCNDERLDLAASSRFRHYRPGIESARNSCSIFFPGAPHQPHLRSAREGRPLDLWEIQGLLSFGTCLFLFQLANASILPLAGEALIYQGESRSSLIVSALMVLPQIVVAMMAPWIGRQANQWGRSTASSHRIGRIADPCAAVRADHRLAAVACLSVT